MDRLPVLRRLRGDERGITTVVVGVSLTALFAAMVLSIDMGNLWKTRRAAVTATDAAALAEARAVALGGAAAACQRWETVLTANGGAETEPVSCTAVPTGAGSGYVRVEARMPSDVSFGAPVGIEDDARVFSQSTALWGQVRSMTRVRPIAICIQNTHVRSWLNLGSDTGVHPSPGVHRVFFNKENPDDCGGNAPGNWGFLDFDGGGNPNPSLITWLTDGWAPEISVRDCDGDGVAGGTCNADTGSSGASVTGALSSLVSTNQWFTVVVFDRVVGSGNNVEYDIAAFLNVRLRGFLVTGPESGRYLDLEFRRVIAKGSCCVEGPNTGVVDIRLCAVDHDPVAEATRCTLQ